MGDGVGWQLCARDHARGSVEIERVTCIQSAGASFFASLFRNSTRYSTCHRVTRGMCKRGGPTETAIDPGGQRRLYRRNAHQESMQRYVSPSEGSLQRIQGLGSQQPTERLALWRLFERTLPPDLAHHTQQRQQHKRHTRVAEAWSMRYTRCGKPRTVMVVPLLDRVSVSLLLRLSSGRPGSELVP